MCLKRLIQIWCTNRILKPIIFETDYFIFLITSAFTAK